MEVLFQDDRVIVLIKPSGILSTDEPGGMPELIRQALEDPEASVRSVHRLDRPVGGVMVYARTRRAAADLSLQIQEGRFRKEYLALVHGRPAHSGGEMRDFLARDKAAHKTRIVGPEDPDAREAVLSYALIASDDTTSLLSVSLQTGRTHQIRCQLAARGMPILGDAKYGAPDGRGQIALWSRQLTFYHPRTGERLVFSAPPPEEAPWNRFLSVL